MKIAFIGQKGIPATFGGVEQHVDELAQGLKERGHDVDVYVRDWYTSKNLSEYHGVRLLHTPTIQSKHLDAFLHSFTSSIHSIFQKNDIIHYHALGPSFFDWIRRYSKERLWLRFTVWIGKQENGVDWHRDF